MVLVYLAIFLPLIVIVSANLLSLVNRHYHANLRNMIIITSGITFLASLVVFYQVYVQNNPIDIYLFKFFYINWGFKFDAISTIFLLMISLIAFIVQIYSYQYLAKDTAKFKFFVFLMLFTLFMDILVLADNLLVMYVGWEGISIFSFLLIGFNKNDENAGKSAKFALIFNKIADIMLLAAILIIYNHTNSFNFNVIFKIGYELELPCFLIAGAALIKSAQFIAHRWLISAMTAPQPVSALLHSATMVAAGPFLLIRMFPLLQDYDNVLKFVLIIGLISAFAGALVAIADKNIKRILAYSTISQLGLIFVVIGMAETDLAFLHLIIHSVVKAMMFLSTGIIINQLAGEKNIRKMGGLYKNMPKTFAVMIIGAATLMGLPFTAGFFSKSMILNAAFKYDMNLLSFILPIVIILTVIYCLRLIFLIFFGQANYLKDDLKVDENNKLMLFSTIILAILTVLLCFVLYYNERSMSIFEIFNPYHISFITIGIFMGYFLYYKYKNLPCFIRDKMPNLTNFITYDFYLEKIIHFIIITPFFMFANLLNAFENLMDKLFCKFIPYKIQNMTLFIRKMQTGIISNYVLYIIFGLILIFFIFLLNLNSSGGV